MTDKEDRTEFRFSEALLWPVKALVCGWPILSVLGIVAGGTAAGVLLGTFASELVASLGVIGVIWVGLAGIIYIMVHHDPVK